MLIMTMTMVLIMAIAMVIVVMLTVTSDWQRHGAMLTMMIVRTTYLFYQESVHQLLPRACFHFWEPGPVPPRFDRHPAPPLVRQL